MQRATTTRLFQNAILERLSRIHPVTPFVAWIPIIVLVASRAAAEPDIGKARTALLAISGFLLWTLTEYVLHRWVFHYVVDGKLGERLHFMIHGVHHAHPRDPDRVVMPLLVSLPLGLVFCAMFLSLFGAPGFGIFAGFAIGYLAYDGLHWAIHQRALNVPVLRHVRRHHLIHHGQPNRAFGVSSPIWDYVFRTMPKKARR